MWMKFRCEGRITVWLRRSNTTQFTYIRPLKTQLQKRVVTHGKSRVPK
jgi:hypothetical protein